MALEDDRRLGLLVPGPNWARTGGFQYDRRMAKALQASGWRVEPAFLAGGWPHPGDAARQAAHRAVEAWPDGLRVLADGLAYGVLADVAERHARRLRWVALVHHPLHLETGLDAAAAAQLREDESKALRFARRVVVTSDRTAADVQALGVEAERIAVVAPGVDRPADTADARARESRPAGAPVRLLCVATLTRRKGHATLLQALAGLRPSSATAPDWELHLVGSPDRDPDTAAALRRQAEALGLQGRVHWHGEVDDDALAGHYRRADALLLPSLHEGHGMVVDEALVAGLPVLCSHAGALPDHLPDDAGWLVPPGDVTAWRDALRTWIDDAALRSRLAEGARRAGAGRPGWNAQAAALATVLQSV